jgi:hypothetical protein
VTHLDLHSHTPARGGVIAYEAHHTAAIQHQLECDPRGVSDGRPWVSCMGDPCRGRARDEDFQGPRRRYAWAVPNWAALTAIDHRSPFGVVEIGAGGGYWAYELRRAGVNVLAYDIDPDGFQGWYTGQAWTRVLPGSHRVAARHPDRTLLLCWPDGAWADQAVDSYRGDTIVYVGQDSDRPTQLHDPLHIVEIPRWADVDDRLEIYER